MKHLNQRFFQVSVGAAMVLTFVVPETIRGTEQTRVNWNAKWQNLGPIQAPILGSKQIVGTKRVAFPVAPVRNLGSDQTATSVEKIPIDSLSTEVIRTVATTNQAGQTETTSSRYIHLKPGSNIQDPVTGHWKPAAFILRPVANGAIAEGGWFTASFVNSLGEAAFTVQTPNGERLQGHLVGLRYEDLSTGQTVMLATRKASVPTVTKDGRVVYADALVWCP